MRVVEILASDGWAIWGVLGVAGAGGAGERSEVLIGLLEGVAPGEVLLVHAGAALARAGEGTPLGELVRAVERADAMEVTP
jgi:hypothetical protein